MSADAWSRCPRCREGQFREDWEIGLIEDTTQIIVRYHGECQSCHLLFEIKEQLHDIPGLEPEPNTLMPIAEVEQRAWSTIPAGWFVRTPDGAWWEVVATEERGNQQRVAMRKDGVRGEWMRPAAGKVSCVPGTNMGPVGTAIAALGGDVQIISDRVE